MRILFTGCAGYIGSVATAALLDAGQEVTGIDSLRFGNGSALLGLIDRRGFRFERADVRDTPRMLHLAAGCGAVVHAAALVGAPLCDAAPDEAREVNDEAAARLAYGLPAGTRLVLLSTNSGYGACEFAGEDSPLNPLSVYGRTKVAAEKAVLSRPNSVSLRLATVHGVSPRMRLDLLVNSWVSEMLLMHSSACFTVYEPAFRRNTVNIRDVARAIMRVAVSWSRVEDGAYNVADPSANMTKMSLAMRIAASLGVTPDRIRVGDGRDGDGRDCFVSMAKFQSTGFRCEHSLEDGIREVAAACSVLRPEEIRRMRNA